MRPPPRCTSAHSVCTSCLQAAIAAPCGGGAAASSANAAMASKLIAGKVKKVLIGVTKSLLMDERRRRG
jgi:hypothetical protein